MILRLLKTGSCRVQFSMSEGLSVTLGPHVVLYPHFLYTTIQEGEGRRGDILYFSFGCHTLATQRVCRFHHRTGRGVRGVGFLFSLEDRTRTYIRPLRPSGPTPQDGSLFLTSTQDEFRQTDGGLEQ